MSPQREILGASPTRIGEKSTPKDRGCFQCSRRRINCDKTEPSCGKCMKRGIECSGINRIRFAEGVARRGKFKDLKVPDISSDGVDCLPITTPFLMVRWQDENKKHANPKRDLQRQHRKRASASKTIAIDGGRNISLSPIPMAAASTNTHFDGPGSPQAPEKQNIETHVEEGIEEIPWIAPLSPKTRELFSYFSDVIAPAMVILDTSSNGYRDILLPMALEDEVLCRAVAVVAAQHLSRERLELQEVAEAGRTAIISRLRRDSLSATADRVFNQFTWATLIVLLVGETVTGSADYSFLIQMLLCLSANSTVKSQELPVNRFLQTQTNMFEMLGIPLLSESNGIATLQGLSRWQDWQMYEQFPEGADNRRIILKIRQCYSAACDIYIQRATSGNKEWPISTLHQSELNRYTTTHHLMELLSQIPPDMPGAHCLVWPCFLGGAEATDHHQRNFFVDYMYHIYAPQPKADGSLKDLLFGNHIVDLLRYINNEAGNAYVICCNIKPVPMNALKADVEAR
ncbi:C6 zinc finger domain containing protein [Pyrenophora tritici-repentis Pt-1C-BFP]|uniref:C6 zinc finger domain containing protein n=1 Tax=Pyrenophora tritici-repentis (strain Pt-1C-BFP) TaxID=426418 RepID=B2WNI0_PYRTR|nr:C6 zinc finger domain containing protein [Pyrenophora tritici-repentis Pt-1C-BFP]EDU44590.1 C6 zinc finger domain containing protein [Pyrenophora tritici-repentis Pt-1C-BFP]